MKILFRTFIICVCITFLACGKEELKQTVPWAPVFFKVNLNNLDTELTALGGYKTFTKARLADEQVGFSGLLIVRNLINESDGTPILLAYDLCCPNDRMKEVRVSPQANGKAKCNKCGSVFNLYSGGNPESGPSESGLQRYQAIPERPYNGIFRISRQN
ncbi:hypothetical protein [Dysgonomonas sp. ZJ709]|uniref:hypothetical protein n=1 Tax=Dysgonomonas sp. ZJ709 TaxID=2709797 RepID=UPI0013EE34B3|nr:hypothetical protein [Dysgonomonas sp. ZJ709]